MKFTEGAFRDWGYQLAKSSYDSEDLDGGPWQVIKRMGIRSLLKMSLRMHFYSKYFSDPLSMMS